MKERPIIFSGPMVRAILSGHKTQTRRPMKPQPQPNGMWSEHFGDFLCLIDEYPPSATIWNGAWLGADAGELHCCPYGVPGDRLFPAMEIPSLGRNYCADTFGAIWSRAKDGETWKRLKGSATSKGYLSVTPAVDCKYATRLVHRLVAEAFYGSAPEHLRQVRHLNGDRTDNSPENLDYGTQHDNWADRLLHGKASGENHHAAKLTAEQVAEIRASCAPQRFLSAQFKVSQSTIWGIREGITWVENPPFRPPNMPRWASRLLLEVKSIRVERVKEISESEAVAEGCTTRTYVDGRGVEPATLSFRYLWDSINEKRGFGWSVNPWVWAVEFERVVE